MADVAEIARLAEQCEENARSWVEIAIRDGNPNFVNEAACQALGVALTWQNRATLLRNHLLSQEPHNG